MQQVYTESSRGEQWLVRYRNQQPLFACVLGFTETGLRPGISAAGATPADRQYTAIADAEFLYRGPQPQPAHALPPLQAGASPALISRAVITGQGIPLQIFNAGLPQPPTVPHVDLGGCPARCLSTGQAQEPAMIAHLFRQGYLWGERLAQQLETGYLILGECVVGGTTTALAVLTALGFDAKDRINSSHPTCNHAQKWELVQQGLAAFQTHHLARVTMPARSPLPRSITKLACHPFELVAALGDPMQIVAAGMMISASCRIGVLLAGGTQMLAVYALARAIAQVENLPWYLDQIVVGTTRWVAEDPTGDTLGLAKIIGDVPLIGTQLSFARSRYKELQVYEQGYVKEGVGAGGCAIAANLYQAWGQTELLHHIEALLTLKLQQNQLQHDR